MSDDCESLGAAEVVAYLGVTRQRPAACVIDDLAKLIAAVIREGFVTASRPPVGQAIVPLPPTK